MQYLLLIYTSELDESKMTEAELGAYVGEYMEFSKGISASGHIRGGDALQPVSTATTVRVRGGKTTRSDGPFAETKEQLGGYYVIEAVDMAEACAIAARIPGARLGSIEVRPIQKY
jgi:hypothetical protein